MANPNWKLIVLRALIIMVAGLWIYTPSIDGYWLWDDDTDIANNPLLQTTAGLRTIWLEPGKISAYYPLTFSVEWLEWHLWGQNTAGYHLTSLIFHLLNGLLLWRLLSRLGLRLAWLGGLLFVIHPANVESVAWMVELKNTLSLAPFILAMIAWVDYEEHRRARDYWLAWGLFVVAMLCKTTPMMFPFIILLYAWWKHGRIGWSAIKSSLPFFPVSIVLCFATTFLQHHHSTLSSDIPLGGVLSRIACAGVALVFYFAQFFQLVRLLPIYPQWQVNPPSPIQFLPWLVLAIVVWWLWTQRKGWGRHALLGLGFFVINLLPVLGFKLFSYMGYTWVFDHFLYIPMIGLIGLTVAAIAQIEDRLPESQRPIWMIIVVVLFSVLILRANAYDKLFFDQKLLWTYELRYNELAWPAHDNLGNELFSEGDLDGAVAHYQRALQINPYRFEAHNNLGLALSIRKQYTEAVEEYAKSISINPVFVTSRLNMAGALEKLGRNSEAIEQYQEVLKLDPNDNGNRDRLNKLQKDLPDTRNKRE